MKRILVVDDNREILQLVAEILSMAGYKVETAASGRECLKKSEEFRPDMFLLYLKMRDMGGWELIDALEERDILKSAKVGVITAETFIDGETPKRTLNPNVHFIPDLFWVQRLLRNVKNIFQNEK